MPRDRADVMRSQLELGVGRRIPLEPNEASSTTLPGWTAGLLRLLSAKRKAFSWTSAPWRGRHGRGLQASSHQSYDRTQNCDERIEDPPLICGQPILLSWGCSGPRCRRFEPHTQGKLSGMQGPVCRHREVEPAIATDALIETRSHHAFHKPRQCCSPSNAATILPAWCLLSPEAFGTNFRADIVRCWQSGMARSPSQPLLRFMPRSANRNRWSRGGYPWDRMRNRAAPLSRRGYPARPSPRTRCRPPANGRSGSIRTPR